MPCCANSGAAVQAPKPRRHIIKIEQTALEDVLLLAPNVFADKRGFFFESYNQKTFEALGIGERFVQDNHSHSYKGVLRGIHYQIENPQGKLVRAIRGNIFDVAVDLRRSSRTFGQWAGFELSDENRKLLWVPPGFGHAFCVLSESAEVAYKATDFYAPKSERTIVWNDPQIAIAWPLQGLPIVSEKDLAGRYLKDSEVFS